MDVVQGTHCKSSRRDGANEKVFPFEGFVILVGQLAEEDYRKTALAAARVLGLRMAGVDMIESAEGPMVLEVNSSPGLEGIQKTTDIDVAKAVIEHIERELKPASRDGRS